MKIKAYIYFPETDVAFQNLHDNLDFYNRLIEELYLVKGKLKSFDDYELCFDQTNISAFINVANGYITDKYLASVKKRLQEIIGNKSKNVHLPKLRNPQIIYANWTIDLNVSVTPFVIAEAAEDTLKDSINEKTICVCLGNSVNVKREELHIIRDAVQISEFPSFVNVSATNDNIGFVRWTTTIPEGKFVLKGNANYEPLEKFWKKERIYKHKATGNYWYFDFNHKDNNIHYEVFDDTGNNHLGEADVNGNINPNTSSSQKKISNIL